MNVWVVNDKVSSHFNTGNYKISYICNCFVLERLEHFTESLWLFTMFSRNSSAVRPVSVFSDIFCGLFARFLICFLRGDTAFAHVLAIIHLRIAVAGFEINVGA